MNKRFCIICGTEFDADGAEVYCQDCKATIDDKGIEERVLTLSKDMIRHFQAKEFKDIIWRGFSLGADTIVMVFLASGLISLAVRYFTGVDVAIEEVIGEAFIVLLWSIVCIIDYHKYKECRRKYVIEQV